MTDSLLIASLACELAGGLLLAKSLAIGDTEEYIAATENEWGRSLLYRDLGRARDMTDAGAGVALLVVGIAGQIAAAVFKDQELGRWWYLILAGVLAIALVIWRVLIEVRQRQVIAARLRSRRYAFGVTLDDYEMAFRELGKDRRGDVLIRAFGRRWFEKLERQIRAEAAKERGEDTTVVATSRSFWRLEDLTPVASKPELVAAAGQSSAEEVVARLVAEATDLSARAGTLMTFAGVVLVVAPILEQQSVVKHSLFWALAGASFFTVVLAMLAQMRRVGVAVVGAPAQTSDLEQARNSLRLKTVLTFAATIVGGATLLFLVLAVTFLRRTR